MPTIDEMLSLMKNPSQMTDEELLERILVARSTKVVQGRVKKQKMNQTDKLERQLRKLFEDQGKPEEEIEKALAKLRENLKQVKEVTSENS